MTDKPVTFAAALVALPEGATPTKAMFVAAAQRWTVAPGTKAELEAQLAAVTAKPTPTAGELYADSPHVPTEECEKEAKRLAGNAKVNAWRVRSRLQASIDLRSVKAKAVRAKGAQKVGPTPAVINAALDLLAAEFTAAGGTVEVNYLPDYADDAQAADSAAEVA